MAKKVDINETLLKEYKDKDLIHYVAEGIRAAISDKCAEEISDEAKLSMRLARVGEYYKILSAVDKRMNKESDDPKFAM